MFGLVKKPRAKDTGLLHARDVWVNFCAGGGGYGDPLPREPARVERDVRIGLCSPAQAEKLYGVALRNDLKCDLDKTQAMRDERRRARVQSGLGWPGNPRTVTTKGESSVLFRCGETLSVHEMAGGAVYRCDCCSAVLGSASEDLRRLLLLIERPIAEMAPVNAIVAAPAVVLREYCCPGCGTLVSTDVPLRTNDPWCPDMRLAAPRPAS